MIRSLEDMILRGQRPLEDHAACGLRGIDYSHRDNTAVIKLRRVMSTNIPVAFLVLGALLSLYVVAALWRSRPK